RGLPGQPLPLFSEKRPHSWRKMGLRHDDGNPYSRRSARAEVSVKQTIGVVFLAERLQALPVRVRERPFGARWICYDVRLAYIITYRKRIQRCHRLAMPCGVHGVISRPFPDCIA